MKALILDDESHVRECINILADWKKHGITQVFEASTVDEAIECISLHDPEVIFTDIKMPDKDGLDLLAWVHEHCSGKAVVVVSGYNDFDYAIGAMRYGALDYILKPIQITQLEAVLQKIDDYISNTQEKYIQANHDAQRLTVNEKIMLALLTEGDITLSADSTLNRLFAAPCGLLLVDFTCIPFRGTAPMADEMDAALACIEGVLNGGARGHAFYGNKHKHVVAVLLSGEHAVQETACREILSTLEAAYHGKLLHVAALNAVHSAQMLPIIYRETAAKAQNHALIANASGTGHAPGFPFTVLQKTLAGMDMGMGEMIINQWTGQYFRSEYITADAFREWRSQYCANMEAFLQANGGARADLLANGTLGLSRAMLPVLTGDGRMSPELLKELLLREAHQMAGILQNESPHGGELAERIADYIEAHYSEEISLNTLSQRFHRNPSYVARLFKDKYGTSVTNHIAAERIKRAKQFLKTPGLRVSKAAYLVGYQDEKYFCRVFKKVTGMTPNEYRKL